jgi:hypothetical protein
MILPAMITADQYRRWACDFHARAQAANDTVMAAEWTRLAQWYLRLANEAVRNSKTDIVYEVGSLPKLGDTEA